ncbi:hypothetical protein [Sphingomonas nostoxanthinifaciens]|uniref:hypothetical protein n=1 Tax=Sphingomonas nostoxanthinifaciens TaxID=2872652 RepID=UPI001CC219B1|nr:hypothetical protein [Sphingomonas nostoxanthinifaciens]UAK23694.1 hypothetical protein K8P63_15080 [Sphingomonas nostoxanthinifaciens]
MTDPTMIERVARALCAVDNKDPNEFVDTPIPREVRVSVSPRPKVPLWTRYERHSRAAIEAMREPTRAMMDAGFLANPNTEGLAPPVYAWPAMIDAALAEEG